MLATFVLLTRKPTAVSQRRKLTPQDLSFCLFILQNIIYDLCYIAISPG